MEKSVDVAKVFLDENGICRFKFDASKGNRLSKKEAYELIDAIYEVCEEESRPILVDARDIIGVVDHDARFLMRNSEKMLKVRKAEAFLVNSRRNWIIALFYINFNRPPNPAKVFTSEEEAITWLKGHL